MVDETETAVGARLLRRQLLAPLTEVEPDPSPTRSSEAFVIHPRLRDEVRQALSKVTDLERLGVRCALMEATPRDLGALRDGLQATARCSEILKSVNDDALKETLQVVAPEPIYCSISVRSSPAR